MSEAYDVMLEQPLLPRQQPLELVASSSDENTTITKDADDSPEISVEFLGNVPFSEDQFKMYLQKIGRIPLLNAEQEVDLSQWIEVGVYARQKLNEAPENFPEQERLELEKVERIGADARKTMIESNLRLVVSEAAKHMGRGLDLSDLVQEGNIGLMHAVELFDYTKGYKFSTYATHWINQAVTRAIANQANTIRKPVNLMHDIYKVRRIDREVRVTTGHEASVQDLMQRLNISHQKAMLWREASRNVISLDYPVGETKDMTVGDLVEDTSVISPEARAEHNSLLKTLDNCLSLLSERELRILQMRYGLNGQAPQTLDQISPVFGVTRERIRQIEFTAIKRIRTAVERGIIANPFSEAI